MADSSTSMTSSFTPPAGSGMSPSDFYNALVGDPFYVMQKAYLDSTGTLASSTLGTQTDIANQKNALTNQRIQFNLADTQRNITNDLASRQATESGDNAFYHTHASQLAGFDTQQSALDLQDYLAGVQAAYAQGVLDRQNDLNTDLFGAYNRSVQYYQGQNTGDAPPPDTPPDVTPPVPAPPPQGPLANYGDSTPGGRGGF